jgi:hypothetical protein
MKKVFLFIFCFGMLLSGNTQQPPVSASNSDPSMPTYLVDGKITPYAQVVKINPNTIESMNVFKGAEAIKKFGNKYPHGLVMVQLKKGKKK